MPALTFYHAPRSRSFAVLWLLKELSADFELKAVSIRRQSGEGARDPANPHPYGKVPALIHGGETVFETPAIALYLTDLYGAAGLGPLPGEAGRGRYLSLLAHYGSVLEPAVVEKAAGRAPHGAAGWPPAETVAGYLLGLLEEGPWFLGARFSALDALYGAAFGYFRQWDLLEATPRLTAYLEACRGRPAFAEAQALDGAV
ncbi:glutathione S-transferase family protein [Neomegalonema perideroedes]|uniref:glutathione S-transferase family protein n=1 Tax=Neomegalonema perideroedes TaxID=217219 RepID=UPI000374F8E8|nr:glutathione S-transferase family protein [Neomegalonema perideroedes]